MEILNMPQPPERFICLLIVLWTIFYKSILKKNSRQYNPSFWGNFNIPICNSKLISDMTVVTMLFQWIEHLFCNGLCYFLGCSHYYYLLLASHVATKPSSYFQRFRIFILKFSNNLLSNTKFVSRVYFHRRKTFPHHDKIRIIVVL